MENEQKKMKITKLTHFYRIRVIMNKKYSFMSLVVINKNNTYYVFLKIFTEM